MTTMRIATNGALSLTLTLLAVPARAQAPEPHPQVLVIIVRVDILAAGVQPSPPHGPPVVEPSPPPRPSPAEPPPAQPHSNLMLPTIAYVGGITGSWVSASANCVGRSCGTLTPILPTVENPRVAVTAGLLLQGGTLFAIHEWIAPRWPGVAKGLLYALSGMHTLDASTQVNRARRRARGESP